MKLNRGLSDQVFGIGRYRYSKDGQLYYAHGKSRIKDAGYLPYTGNQIKRKHTDARNHLSRGIFPVKQEL